MIKGIILDVDGTTLETLNDIKASLNMALEKYGFAPRNYEQVRLGIGRGSRKLIEVSVPENVDAKTIDDITNKYMETYGHHYAVETKPYEGIKELLNKLEERGIVLAVNTNKPDAFAKDLFKIHFPDNKFLAIIGSRPNIPNKPDPTSCNEIVAMMGFKKEEILYVGDSDSDVATAKNAGLKCVGCLWGFRDLKTLQDAKADYIVKTPKEILEII